MVPVPDYGPYDPDYVPPWGAEPRNPAANMTESDIAEGRALWRANNPGVPEAPPIDSTSVEGRKKKLLRPPPMRQPAVAPAAQPAASQVQADDDASWNPNDTNWQSVGGIDTRRIGH